MLSRRPHSQIVEIVCFSILLITLATCQSFSPSCASQNPNSIYCNSWRYNVVHNSTYFGVWTEVQDVNFTTIDGVQFAEVRSNGIPRYDTTITQEILDRLDSRPKAATDFYTGSATVSVGDVVSFGEDIGYNASVVGCYLGYWPPGPDCPAKQNDNNFVPVHPKPATRTCYQNVGPVGRWINGVSVYNWWDGTTYNNTGTWHTLANHAELYDIDICFGHAQRGGDYHHHGYPQCLSVLLNDDGSSKSPIYGFGFDGYPILGPYVAEGVLAKSCWKIRDYADPNSPTGCGEAFKRTCAFVNPTDISQGKITVAQGPDTDVDIYSQSDNEFLVDSGYYFEDYYFDSSCPSQGEEYLDVYNGRYDSQYGYVYHITVDFGANGTEVNNHFPHFMGPVYYGELYNTSITCDSNLFDWTVYDDYSNSRSNSEQSNSRSSFHSYSSRSRSDDNSGASAMACSIFIALLCAFIAYL